jgi:hypothetical protein
MTHVTAEKCITLFDGKFILLKLNVSGRTLRNIFNLFFNEV